MRGLFQSERANMLRMSEVNEVDHQSMQHMLTERCVDWQGFGRQLALEANELLGSTDAVLIFDESDFAKGKGEASAGVARQWNGRLGKVDNWPLCRALHNGQDLPVATGRFMPMNMVVSTLDAAMRNRGFINFEYLDFTTLHRGYLLGNFSL